MSGFRFLALLPLAIAIALGSHSAQAGTCGDYLAGSHHVMLDEMHESAPESSSGSLPAAPCHGPNCKQGKPDSIPMPPPAPTSQPTARQFGVLLTVASTSEAAKWNLVDEVPSGYALLLAGGIFHPPRAC